MVCFASRYARRPYGLLILDGLYPPCPTGLICFGLLGFYSCSLYCRLCRRMRFRTAGISRVSSAPAGLRMFPIYLCEN